MTDLKKAAEMALEALENFCEYGVIQQPIEKRDALRQSLAQPEQTGIPEFPEPFTKADIEYAPHESWDDERERDWLDLQVCQRNKIRLHKYARQLRELLAKALAQPEQKVLGSGLCLHPSVLDYLDKKKVRTRLDYQPYTGAGEESKIKHSLAPMPEQEPVAWMQDSTELYVNDRPTSIYKIPLYTAPPRKAWVSLSDIEINKIVDLNTSDDGGFDIWCDGIAVARIVCAKLKELNK